MLPENIFASLNSTTERRAFPFHERHVYGPSGDDGSRRFARWSLVVAMILASYCVFLIVSAVLPLLSDNAGKCLPLAQSSPNLNPWEGVASAEPQIAPARQQPRLPEIETVIVPALPAPLFQEPPLLPEAPKIEVPQIPALPEPT